MLVKVVSGQLGEARDQVAEHLAERVADVGENGLAQAGGGRRGEEDQGVLINKVGEEQIRAKEVGSEEGADDLRVSNDEIRTELALCGIEISELVFVIADVVHSGGGGSDLRARAGTRNWRWARAAAAPRYRRRTSRAGRSTRGTTYRLIQRSARLKQQPGASSGSHSQHTK